ncbi:MAG: hypothetical protein RLZ45_3117, partial [Verrucomicrobiota bacterium]
MTLSMYGDPAETKAVARRILMFPNRWGSAIPLLGTQHSARDTRLLRLLGLDLDIQLGMTVDLEVFDFDQEVPIPGRFEGGLVPFGSVPRPVLDDDL